MLATVSFWRRPLIHGTGWLRQMYVPVVHLKAAMRAHLYSFFANAGLCAAEDIDLHSLRKSTRTKVEKFMWRQISFLNCYKESELHFWESRNAGTSTVWRSSLELKLATYLNHLPRLSMLEAPNVFTLQCSIKHMCLYKYDVSISSTIVAQKMQADRSYFRSYGEHYSFGIWDERNEIWYIMNSWKGSFCWELRISCILFVTNWKRRIYSVYV
jgi:hypothetical protein